MTRYSIANRLVGIALLPLLLVLMAIWTVAGWIGRIRYRA